MRERYVQDKLFSHLFSKGHNLIVPNVHVNGWEADLVSVSKSLLINEYEIKTSVADYRNDFNGSRSKIHKHRVLSGKGRRSTSYTPNYFWYVITFEQHRITVPHYAGLIILEDYDGAVLVNEIKRAPRIHADKLSTRNIDYLARGLNYRYWKLRTKAKKRRIL